MRGTEMSKNRILSEHDYRHIYSLVPRLTVDLLVFRSDRSVLLTKRRIAPFRGCWHFPGGRVFHRESIDAAVRRVGRAELGQGIKVKRFVGYMETLRDGKFTHSVSLVFEVIPKSDEFVLDRQSSEAAFFGRLPHNLIASHRKFLDAIR